MPRGLLLPMLQDILPLTPSPFFQLLTILLLQLLHQKYIIFAEKTNQSII